MKKTITKENVDEAINRNVVVYDKNSPQGTISLNLLNLIRVAYGDNNLEFFIHCTCCAGQSKTESLLLLESLKVSEMLYTLYETDYDITKHCVDANCCPCPHKDYYILCKDSKGKFGMGMY